MKLGYSTWGMPQVPIDEALAAIARMGYQGVEITVLPRYTTALETLDTGERRRIRRLLDTHGLELPAIAAHSSLLAEEPEAHAANMARLKGAADLAAEWGGEHPPAVNTTTGGRREAWEEVRHRLVDRIGELVDYARGRGVTVAIEPHVGATLDTPEKSLWLLEQVRSPFLMLNLDFSHFEAVGLPMEETVAALAPHSIHTHVKDTRGRYPDHEFLIPGEGGFDYAAYLRATRAAGYEGFITAEVSVMVQRRPGYDPFAAAEQSYRALAAAFAEAGIVRG
jgi:sugar phosphate isomerase/epimerase